MLLSNTQSKKSAFSLKNQFSQLSSTIQMLSAYIWVIRWKNQLLIVVSLLNVEPKTTKKDRQRILR